MTTEKRKRIVKKQLLILSLLLSTTTFSSLSFGEWVKSAESADGSCYINFSDIRKDNEYVYWWQLNDLIEPNKGILSSTTYHQTDCLRFRTKYLRGKVYKANMADGTAEREYDYESPKWIYPAGHLQGQIMRDVCDYVLSK